MALGVRVSSRRVRELADQLRKVGQKPRELTSARAQIGAKDFRLADTHEAVECCEEGPVRRANHRVAGAVEDQGAVTGRVLRELADQPALSGAGLAGDERDPAAFAPGVRQERSKRGEFPRAADEGKRQRKAEWTRESQRVARGHSQI